MKTVADEIRLPNRRLLSSNTDAGHIFLTRRHPSHAIADRDDARRRNGGAGSVTANDSGCAALVAMAQAGALPAQDGQLMLQVDELELQREATTNPEREQRTEGGQKREHA
ncbi:MAG: hypothetical protein HQ465_27050, partial [Rhodospirillales bacterium]|nr:hypothetical protein [Rhodospirillales bacterium]